MEQQKEYTQPAFPTIQEDNFGSNYGTPGMTLLDYFAGQVISNLDHRLNTKLLAKMAYQTAAAMMEERKKYLQ